MTRHIDGPAEGADAVRTGSGAESVCDFCGLEKPCNVYADDTDFVVVCEGCDSALREIHEEDQ